MAMLTPREIEDARERAAALLREAGIALTDAERANLEVADFGLGQLERQGLEIVTYINTDRYCAKELVLFARQTCPQHRHPALGGRWGKMETFRCRHGIVWLYVAPAPGDVAPMARPAAIKGIVPPGSEAAYTVFTEIELKPGEQYTIPSDTLHWFQAGDGGAVVSEFSSPSDDASDIFTDPAIRRLP
jgi:D-lyxose ketol-isomerase